MQISSVQGEQGDTGGLRTDGKDAWHPGMSNSFVLEMT